MVRAAEDVETKTRSTEIDMLVKSVIDTVRQMPAPHDHRTIVKAMKRTIPDGSVSHAMWVEIYENCLEILLQAATASVAARGAKQLSLLPATPRFVTILAATPSGRPMIIGTSRREPFDKRHMQIPVHDR